jgi:hypothetical protein
MKHQFPTPFRAGMPHARAAGRARSEHIEVLLELGHEFARVRVVCGGAEGGVTRPAKRPLHCVAPGLIASAFSTKLKLSSQLPNLNARRPGGGAGQNGASLSPSLRSRAARTRIVGCLIQVGRLSKCAGEVRESQFDARLGAPQLQNLRRCARWLAR